MHLRKHALISTVILSPSYESAIRLFLYIYSSKAVPAQADLLMAHGHLLDRRQLQLREAQKSNPQLAT